MLNQNVAKITPPSYSQVRSNMPIHHLPDHWKGVYYFSGISNQHSRSRLMNRKLTLVKNTASFEGELKNLVRVSESTLSSLASSLAPTTTTTSEVATATTPAASIVSDVVIKAVAFADHGLVEEASAAMEVLYSSPAHSSALSVGDISSLVSALAAPKLRAHILRTEADGDVAASYKLIGDHKAEQRAIEAQKWFQRGVEKVQEVHHAAVTSAKRQGGSPSALSAANRIRQAGLQRLFAGLMQTLLTCGFEQGVRNVPNSVYDTMGAMGVQPTVEHYHCVTLALALSADIEQLRAVTDFAVRNAAAGLPNTATTTAASATPDPMAVAQAQNALLPFYNNLLLGLREARDYEGCSEVWQELCDKRFPRPSPMTADLYIRSIIDHGYTRVSDQYRHFGEMHMVEHKRIPLEVSKLDQLGIPRSHLTQSVQDHVEDALRKYSITKSRFYQWGRAVKQFDFIEFRRKNGWLYDIREMVPTTSFIPTPRRLPWQDGDDDGNISSAGTVDTPLIMTDVSNAVSRPWEHQALSHMMTTTNRKEHMHDTKSADYFHDDIKPLHDRGPGWSNRVPQTRYNNLYSLNAPNVPKIGIRRHLEAERAYSGASIRGRDGDSSSTALPISSEEHLQRDAGLMRSVVSTARRQRQRAGGASTHRESAL